MCRETIRKAVIQKFKEVKGWNCESINELYNKIDNINDANEIVNSIKICDPAVGSGHFLVSALNEIIAVKNDLRILQDREGKRLKEFHIEVVNDELITTDDDGLIFEYNPKSKESQRVQETLFHEKQSIIENCLFGVDINPNSVKICRLRLWIELLKNAYYKNETELETLPNIDINIKCGNSLISRFAIDADLGQALKKSKWNIDSYRLAVSTYRNAQNKEQKREMERLIADIKSDFRSEIASNDPKIKRLQKIKGELYSLSNQTSLFEKSKKEKEEWNKKVQKFTDEIKKLESEIEEIKNNQIYENAFEWRFEFPEVLNEKGDFVGFDMVIGNPPYIDIRAIDAQSKQLFNFNYTLQRNSFDLYSLFIERGLQILSKGILHFIIPKPFLYNSTFQPIRKLIFKYQVIEFFVHNNLVFEDANVETCLIQIKKTETKNSFAIKTETNHYKQSYSLDYLEGLPLVIADDNVLKLLEKLNKFTKLENLSNIIRGLELGKNTLSRVEESENTIKIFAGEAIEKFRKFDSKFFHVNKSDLNGYLKPNELFEKYPRLLMRRVSQEPIATILESGEPIVNNLNSVYNIALNQCSDYSIYFLCGVLNSKISKFYIQKSFSSDEKLFPYIRIEQLKKIPIPKYDSSIDFLVKKTIDSFETNTNDNSSDLEQEINIRLYQLFNLTKEEIEIIEST
jgi:hypothetical protein